MSGSDLYAVGNFTEAGGSAGNGIAKWDGSSWTALGSGLGAGAIAVAVSGSNVYAGGGFTTVGGSAANYIARWDGSNWSALGTGVNGIVYNLAVSGNDLYAGGTFTTAGGIPANYIAKWDGSNWTALGSGMGNSVEVLVVSGNVLYVGGDFTTAGGKVSAYVAKANLNAPFLTEATKLPIGPFQFAFTNTPSTTFNALASTNAALPASNWTTLGPVTETAPGQYQFSDPAATNLPRRFYRVLAP